MLDDSLKPPLNGIDLQALEATIGAIAEDPELGKVAFRVKTRWKGRTRSESVVESYSLAGEAMPRSFTILADEPEELLGSNSAPNPQELLMSAVNACMMV